MLVRQDRKGRLCQGGREEKTLGWEPKETLAQCGHPGGKDTNLGHSGGREAEPARATEVTLVV